MDWISHFYFTIDVFFYSPYGFVLYGYVNDDFAKDGKNTWMVSDNFLSGWYFKILIAAIISALLAVLAFFSIGSYKKDAASGVKLKAPYTVMRKEYYPVTGQYFVHLGGMAKHSEVDADTYNKCEEDGIVYLGQAPRSKYIFSEDDEYLQFLF